MYPRCYLWQLILYLLSNILLIIQFTILLSHHSHRDSFSGSFFSTFNTDRLESRVQTFTTTTTSISTHPPTHATTSWCVLHQTTTTTHNASVSFFFFFHYFIQSLCVATTIPYFLCKKGPATSGKRGHFYNPRTRTPLRFPSPLREVRIAVWYSTTLIETPSRTDYNLKCFLLAMVDKSFRAEWKENLNPEHVDSHILLMEHSLQRRTVEPVDTGTSLSSLVFLSNIFFCGYGRNCSSQHRFPR